MTAFDFFLYCMAGLVICMCLPYLLALAAFLFTVLSAVAAGIVFLVVWPIEKIRNAYRRYKRRKRGQYR